MADSVAQELLRRENLKNHNHFHIVKCLLMNGGIMTSIYKPILSQHILRTPKLGHYIAKYLFSYYTFAWSFVTVFGSIRPPNGTELSDFYSAIRYNRGNEVLSLTIGYMNERDHYGDVWIDALNETAVPVVFVYGPADPINPAASFPARMRRDLPRVKLAVLSELVGHYPQFEDPFTVFGILDSFFFQHQ